MIDITGVDLVEFVKGVYANSRPQGMGYAHYTPGPLSDEKARSVLAAYPGSKNVALSMDYVGGRACKMVVRRSGDRLEIPDEWFDHSDADLDNLLAPFGIKRASAQTEAA